MNIHTPNCGIDVDDLNPTVISVMDYLHSYLENGWNIKKNKRCYIIKKKDSKIVISDTIQISNLLPKCNNDGNCDSNSDSTTDISNKKNIKYILCFLYNVLNSGWTIKKPHNNDEYVFIKNHEGKKEIFSKKYLHTFLKENFNLNLIK